MMTLSRMPLRARRGATLIEVVIAATILILVSLIVVSISLAVARQTQRSLSYIPAQTSAYRLMDRVRSELLAAQLGTVQNGAAGEREITYLNPARGTASSLLWNNTTGQLIFRADIASVGSPNVVWGTLDDCVFEIIDNDRRVQVTMARNTVDLRRRTRPVRFQDTITLRN